jgi:hypothetical protein
MMKKILIVLAFLSQTLAAINFQSIDGSLKNDWQAGNLSQAASLLEGIKDEKMLAWQKARLLYNLGTIYLGQNREREAIDLFAKIKLEELRLPSFARYLMINQGIAYLKMAKKLSAFQDEFSLAQQSLFIDLGEKYFKDQSCLESFICEWQSSIADLKDQLYQRQIIHLVEQTEPADLISYLNQKQLDTLSNFYLSYRFAIIKPIIEPLKQLLERMKANSDDQLKPIITALSTSIEKIESNQFEQAKSFFYLGLSYFESLNINVNHQALDYLNKAISQAIIAYKLSSLSLLYVDKIDLQFPLKEALQQIKPMIQQILLEQNTAYQKHHCQIQPWHEVIPLIDRGYQSGRKAFDLLNNQLISTAIANQESMIKDWLLAKKLMLAPQKKNEKEAENQAIQSKTIQETFRLIQEMYKEDQAHQVVEQKEFERW